MSNFFVHESAYADEPVHIGDGTKIWHFSHVMSGAEIGRDCILGQNVHVGSGVKIGNRVKIQNNVSVYTGAILEDEVFLGPSCVMTNVTNPRSDINRHEMFETTLLKRGTTVGANATIVCGSTLGYYSFIAAGAVVAGEVPDYALMVGVPAKQKGWMSRHGYKLTERNSEGNFLCPGSGFTYSLQNGNLRCLDIGETEDLPVDSRAVSKTYRNP